jgi:hypothetical protein
MAVAKAIGDMPFERRERELKAACRFIADLVAREPASDPKIEKGWNSLIEGRA